MAPIIMATTKVMAMAAPRAAASAIARALSVRNAVKPPTMASSPNARLMRCRMPQISV